MADHYYMRPVHTMNEDGRLYAFVDQEGCICTDPYDEYKRYLRSHERRMSIRHNVRSTRQGRMFAVWKVAPDSSPAAAEAVAKSTPPCRVCVLTESSGWGKVDFTLPPGEMVHF